MTIKIKDLGNQHINQLEALSEEELKGVIGGDSIDFSRFQNLDVPADTFTYASGEERQNILDNDPNFEV